MADETTGGALAGAAASGTVAVAAPAAAAAPAGGTSAAASAAAAGAAAGSAPAAGTSVPAAGTPASGAPDATAAPSGTPASATTGGATIAAGAAPAPAAGTAPVTPAFPETWRADMAGGDAAAQKLLERYASPKALFEAHLGLVKKISAGELKNVAAAPPENATAEQLAEWRKEAGLPAEPKGYVDGLKLPNGVVPGEGDKPLLEGFAAHALKANMPPGAFNAAVDWYFANVDAQNRARAEADQALAGEAVRTLEKEWGGAFKENQNRIGAIFADAPDVADLIFNARDSKGRILGNIPEVCRALAQAHKNAFPAYSATTPDNSLSGESIDTEMGKIEAQMGDPRSAYNERSSSGQLSDGAKALRSRYRDLINAQHKNKPRAA